MDFGICQTELPWGDTVASAADVTRTTQEIAELGAVSIRMSCTWQEIDPNRNFKYRWANLDRAINAAEAAGLDILLIIEPRRLSWLSLFGVPVGISATPKNARDYGLLCGAIAQRYGDRVTWYEIGNEINSLAAFGSPNDPADYLEFLRAAYPAIKPHAPSSTVLAGALMAVATDPNLGWTMHPVEWVREFYKANPQDSFDGLSIHPYSTGGNFDPQAPTADNEFAVRNIPLIRAIMDANDDAEKLIYCSEWGFDSIRSLTGLSTSLAEREAEQAQHLLTQWNLLKPFADSGVIHPTVWIYNYHDRKPDSSGDFWYGFGLTRLDYTRKAAWSALRSLVIDQDVTLTAAAATAQGWPVEVEEFIDPAAPKLAPATATAQGWPVTVGERLAVLPATATAQGWPVTVEEASVAVEYVSTGAGDRLTTSGGGTKVIDWAHTVTDATGRLLLVGLVVSTSNLRGWENYIPTVTSDLGGAFVRLGSRHIGSASVRHGSVHIYGLYHPPLGEHTITASITDAFADFTAFSGNSVQVRGASGYGSVAAAGSSSGGNTPRISISSMLDNLAFAVFGSRNQLTGFNHNVRHAVGSTVDGDGDWITIGDALGASPSVTFEDTTIGLQIWGALALNIPRMVPPQKAITLTPAGATAQGWPVEVGVAGGVDLEAATATAQGWPVEVTERITLDAAAATAQGWPVEVEENSAVTLEAATAAAQGWPVEVTEAVVVELDAAGAGNRATGATSTLSVNLSHTVGADADYLVVAVVGSWSSASSDWTTLTTFTATSDVDGALTALTTAEVGTQNLGAVRLFGLANPTPGEHTITVTTAKAGTTFSSLMGQTLSYKGVDNTSGANIQESFSGALDLDITSAEDSIVVFVGGWASDRSSSFAGGTVRYNNGGSVGGTGDFAIVADAPGATTVTFTADSGAQVGGAGISLNPPT